MVLSGQGVKVSKSAKKWLISDEFWTEIASVTATQADTRWCAAIPVFPTEIMMNAILLGRWNGCMVI